MYFIPSLNTDPAFRLFKHYVILARTVFFVCYFYFLTWFLDYKFSGTKNNTQADVGVRTVLIIY